jgi:hypothetical protein
MKRERKHALLGPAVIGAIMGIVLGFTSYGFNMEYGASIHPDWHPLWLYATGEALLTAIGCFGGIVLLLGLIPMLLHDTKKEK